MRVLIIVLTVIEGYLLGSLSFGIITTRILAKKDIRTLGSGNAGMTNVLRSVGSLAGALTGFGDFAKGAISIVLGRWLFESAALNPYLGGYLAALFAIMGHLFPLYFGFKGGKGVMTTAGVLLVLNPTILLVLAVLFAIAFAITKTISICSIMAALAYPPVNLIYSLLAGKEWLFSTFFAVCICGLVIFEHRSNIKRIREGTEKKFVIKK
ncbi:MAG: glycerol-3-phosphate 1-O-acyltransferase PlsY [Oscillospiraceae bacterium]